MSIKQLTEEQQEQARAAINHMRSRQPDRVDTVVLNEPEQPTQMQIDRARIRRLLNALKRAEYFLVGHDYLDALSVIRGAISTEK